MHHLWDSNNRWSKRQALKTFSKKNWWATVIVVRGWRQHFIAKQIPNVTKDRFTIAPIAVMSMNTSPSSSARKWKNSVSNGKNFSRKSRPPLCMPLRNIRSTSNSSSIAMKSTHSFLQPTRLKAIPIYIATIYNWLSSTPMLSKWGIILKNCKFLSMWSNC